MILNYLYEPVFYSSLQKRKRRRTSLLETLCSLDGRLGNKKQKTPPKPNKEEHRRRTNTIDVGARVLFPASFTGFTVIFFYVYCWPLDETLKHVGHAKDWCYLHNRMLCVVLFFTVFNESFLVFSWQTKKLLRNYASKWRFLFNLLSAKFSNIAQDQKTFIKTWNNLSIN